MSEETLALTPVAETQARPWPYMWFPTPSRMPRHYVPLRTAPDDDDHYYNHNSNAAKLLPIFIDIHEGSQNGTRKITRLVPSFSFHEWRTHLLNCIWYLRMCLLLVMICMPVALISSYAIWFVGNIAVLGFLKPFKSADPNKELHASAAGAAIVGTTVGLLGFVHLLVRRLRMSAEARKDLRDEPIELFFVAVGSIPGSAFSMAIGMLVVPGLTSETFGVVQALVIGVWGVVMPVTPFLFCGVVCCLLQ